MLHLPIADHNFTGQQTLGSNKKTVAGVRFECSYDYEPWIRGGGRTDGKGGADSVGKESWSFFYFTLYRAWLWRVFCSGFYSLYVSRESGIGNVSKESRESFNWCYLSLRRTWRLHRVRYVHYLDTLSEVLYLLRYSSKVSCLPRGKVWPIRRHRNRYM